MRVVTDTCWFIDLERRRPEAVAYLRANPNVEPLLTEIVRAELFAGGRDISRIDALTGTAEVASINHHVAEAWGRNYRRLRAAGAMIGANDLWLASIAVTHDLPVLTRNVREFERVAGLRVEAY